MQMPTPPLKCSKMEKVPKCYFTGEMCWAQKQNKPGVVQTCNSS